METSVSSSAEASKAPLTRNSSSYTMSSGKKFIVFDQAGGKGRVFLHPGVVHELSPLNLNTVSVDDDYKRANDADFKAVDHLEYLFRNAIEDDRDEDKQLVAYREIMAIACATLQKTRQSRVSSLSKSDTHTQFILSLSDDANSNADKMSSVEEDSEDLEALFSSDDETSTDHSPSSKLEDIHSDVTTKSTINHNNNLKRQFAGYAKNSRRNMQLLRSILPGGMDMNTDLLLERVVQHVKALQAKVQECESSRCVR